MTPCVGLRRESLARLPHDLAVPDERGAAPDGLERPSRELRHVQPYGHRGSDGAFVQEHRASVPPSLEDRAARRYGRPAVSLHGHHRAGEVRVESRPGEARQHELDRTASTRGHRPPGPREEPDARDLLDGLVHDRDTARIVRAHVPRRLEAEEVRDQPVVRAERQSRPPAARLGREHASLQKEAGGMAGRQVEEVPVDADRRRPGREPPLHHRYGLTADFATPRSNRKQPIEVARRRRPDDMQDHRPARVEDALTRVGDAGQERLFRAGSCREHEDGHERGARKTPLHHPRNTKSHGAAVDKRRGGQAQTLTSR